ncbi:MAG: HAD-IC family P-type ATPase [bacterium]|nr:HAD-IC family P-type ATPase [bacterium]
MLNPKIFNSPFHALEKEKVLALLESGEEGLKNEEAKERLKTFGRNAIHDGRGIDKFAIFLSQFKSPLILILLAAGGVTLLLKDYANSVFIFTAVAINTSLGFYQEHKAETALESLKTYLKERARVVREGRETEIDAEEIIPGDIVSLVPGTRVPSDIRLTFANDLTIDESILTGESLSVEKHTKTVKKMSVTADKKNIAFGGTFVETGIARGVTFATGNDTEIGKIAKLVEGREESTPLQKAIKRFSLGLTAVLLVLVTALFIVGTLKGVGYLEMFVTSIAIAVSAVPEGLPIALTVILAVGVEKLAKKKGVVRKLLAAETLGRTSLILTDKTGTLTEGKMELSEIITRENPGRKNLTKENLLELAIITLDIKVENPNSPPKEWRVTQGPLQKAVAYASLKYKVFLEDTKKKFEILDYHPFNSKTKFSAAQVKRDGKTTWIYVGAPEAITNEIGARKEKRSEIHEETNRLAYKGGRVLGIAEENQFLGFLVFKDPVRHGMKAILAKTKEAGIKTKIVTGDHKGTALSVAKEIGLTVKEEETITGEELRELNDLELISKLDTIHIFARIAPEDKLRIVNLYKQKGEVVAMTGDGVNDAPALQIADIGVAVGSGTDVARGAADLVLLDDNFETLITAVEEGRRILENVKKTIIYLLSNAFDGLFLIGGAILLGIPLPLNALQILWVNFFSDSFPAIAFAFENGGNHLGKPVRKTKKLLDAQSKFFIAVIGTTTSLLLFVLYVVLIRQGFEESLVRTFIFATFALYTLFLPFAIRRLDISIFQYNPLGNRYLTGGVGIGVILTLAAIYLPFLQEILHTVSLPPVWLIGIMGFAALNILAAELGKLLFSKRS